MRRAVVVAVLVAVCALGLPLAGAARIPVPEQDPFYAVPANVADYPDGAVISARKVTTYAYMFPLPATSWQLLYKTRDSHGDPTATVATLMVPKAAWKGPGSRPVLSHQTAEDATSGKCAPSYGLRAGSLSKAPWANAESGLMALWLSQGWAVIAPDYEGPQSQFLAGRMNGQAVLDGIRAGLSYGPGGLSPTTPVGMWGYSGGAFATSIAAQLQPAYAPAINLKGVAFNGIPADIEVAIDGFSGSIAGGAIAMGVNGLMRAFPEHDLGQYLSAEGRAKVAAASGDCILDAAMRFPFLRVADLEGAPGMLDHPFATALLRANSPVGIEGTPTVPVLVYHGTLDTQAPVGPVRALVQQWCAAGATVRYLEDPFADHFSSALMHHLDALAFLRDRFAGTPTPSTCRPAPQPG